MQCLLCRQWCEQAKAQSVCHSTSWWTIVHLPENRLACVVEAIIEQSANSVHLSLVLPDPGHWCKPTLFSETVYRYFRTITRQFRILSPGIKDNRNFCFGGFSHCRCSPCYRGRTNYTKWVRKRRGSSEIPGKEIYGYCVYCIVITMTSACLAKDNLVIAVEIVRWWQRNFSIDRLFAKARRQRAGIRCRPSQSSARNSRYSLPPQQVTIYREFCSCSTNSRSRRMWSAMLKGTDKTVCILVRRVPAV